MELDITKKKQVLAEHDSALRRMQGMVFQDHEYVKGPDTAVFSKLCVEVARRDGVVAVRDTKDRSVKPLMFTYQEWTAFTNGVRQGVFDV